MTALDLFGTAWPEPGSLKIRNRNGAQFYDTPEGDMPRVTAVLKCAGLGTEGLIKWSANSERAAVLEAVGELLITAPGQFTVSAVENRLGKARAHQRLLAKAGDIGAEIHGRIQWHLQRELGLKVGPEPSLSSPAAIGFSSWRAWWVGAKRKPVRIEQPVWDPEWGYAGTIDLLSEALPGCPDTPAGSLLLDDWKSSTGIYDTHHMQMAAYLRAANRWAVVVPGRLVHIPKTAGGSLEVVPHELGHLYDGRTLSLDELLAGFKAALTLWSLFVGPREHANVPDLH
jgi:hypothetical protein